MSSTDHSSPNDSIVFSWKPAALRSKREVSVSTEGFVFEKGELITWQDIQGLNFALHHVRGNTMMHLRVRLTDREEILSVNGGGQDLQIYCRMIKALVGAMEAARPDLEITIGNVGGSRLGMFIVGVFGVIVSIGLVIGGIHLSIEEGNWGHLGMSLVGLIFGFFTVLITLANLPWRKAPTHALSEFWKLIERAEANSMQAAATSNSDHKAG